MASLCSSNDHPTEDSAKRQQKITSLTYSVMAVTWYIVLRCWRNPAWALIILQYSKIDLAIAYHSFRYLTAEACRWDCSVTFFSKILFSTLQNLYNFCILIWEVHFQQQHYNANTEQAGYNRTHKLY